MIRHLQVEISHVLQLTSIEYNFWFGLEVDKFFIRNPVFVCNILLQK